MRRPLAAMWGSVVIASVVGLAADDLTISVDPRADLSAIRTFALRDGTIDSPRPELDNPLFLKKLATTIRAALSARGLTHAPDRPDVWVDYTVTGEDHSTTVRTPARGVGPQPLLFTEGTLIIDLIRPGETAPVWRGVYRDDERTGSKLVQNLPEDAKKLILKYPRPGR
jgi:hypothetical protein